MGKSKIQKDMEQRMLSSSKEEREKLNFEYRKNNLTSFDSNFIDRIHPRNKKLLIGFMEYLAYSDMAKKTCQNIKNNLIVFFQWNLMYNNNSTFRTVTKTEGDNFFKYAKEMEYTYTRVKCMKSDICTLADYAQFVLGREEFNNDGTTNQWFSYNHRWREVDIQQKEEDELGFRKSNISYFINNPERLDSLKHYLNVHRDYMALIIIELSWMGKEILFLQEDDVRFSSETKEKYLRWKKRVGAEDIPDVLIARRPDGSYAPMSLTELRRYTQMFSVFLGKEFIIC